MERSFANLEAALSGKLLILVDHRLGSTPGPIFDLRSPGSSRPIVGDAVIGPSPNAQDAAQAPSAPTTSAPDIESY